jgi:transcription elongation factor GreA
VRPQRGSSGQGAASPARQRAGSEQITTQGLAALRAELARLEGDGRREIAARIQAARELGDLKENAEYHIAKEDQAHLETRIARLADRLRKAVVVDADASAEVVGFGATVHVVDVATGRESTYTIVGPTEADLRSGRISAESPVARALLGHRAGEVVAVETPRGARDLRIERLGS